MLNVFRFAINRPTLTVASNRRMRQSSVTDRRIDESCTVHATYAHRFASVNATPDCRVIESSQVEALHCALMQLPQPDIMTVIEL